MQSGTVTDGVEYHVIPTSCGGRLTKTENSPSIALGLIQMANPVGKRVSGSVYTHHFEILTARKSCSKAGDTQSVSTECPTNLIVMHLGKMGKAFPRDLTSSSPEEPLMSKEPCITSVILSGMANMNTKLSMEAFGNLGHSH